MIDAILFDAAGTLIGPAEPVGDTYRRILRRHDIRPADLEAGFRHAFATAGGPDYEAHADGDLAERLWWRRVVELSVGQAVGDTLFAELFDHYASGSAWEILPGVEAALASTGHLRRAVVSNFDLRLHRVLEELKLAHHFEVIVTSAEARARKPCPRIFQITLDRLRLRPGQVRHVGDSPIADGDGAAAAGIHADILGRDLGSLAEFLRKHEISPQHAWNAGSSP